jgi:hypothetical protein
MGFCKVGTRKQNNKDPDYISDYFFVRVKAVLSQKIGISYLKKKKLICWLLVAHACNPGYLGS